MTAVSQWVEAYIGLGANLDDPITQILTAADEIARLSDVERIALSPLYASKPVGPQYQPDYVNAAMRIKTRLDPLQLLGELQRIENHHGRVRAVRWGARTLDLDLLLFGQQSINLPQLTVPHPELAKRAFVLYPLADIADPALPIPGLDSLAVLLAACPADGISKLAP